MIFSTLSYDSSAKMSSFRIVKVVALTAWLTFRFITHFMAHFAQKRCIKLASSYFNCSLMIKINHFQVHIFYISVSLKDLKFELLFHLFPLIQFISMNTEILSCRKNVLFLEGKNLAGWSGWEYNAVNQVLQDIHKKSCSPRRAVKKGRETLRWRTNWNSKKAFFTIEKVILFAQIFYICEKSSADINDLLASNFMCLNVRILSPIPAKTNSRIVNDSLRLNLTTCWFKKIFLKFFKDFYFDKKSTDW